MTRWSLLAVLLLAAGCGEKDETDEDASTLGSDPTSSTDASESGSAGPNTMPQDDGSLPGASSTMTPNTVPPTATSNSTPQDSAPSTTANPTPATSDSSTVPDPSMPTMPEPAPSPMGQGGDDDRGESGNGGMSAAQGGANAGQGGEVSAPEPEPLEGCEGGPLDAPIDGCEPDFEETGDFYEDCVARINQLRWECQCLPPLERWEEGEDCADQQAQYDYEMDEAHAGFRADICENGGSAQNECPGYGPNFGIVDYCLQQMWDEGPGEDFQAHGHYINMSNEDFSRVACGIYETPDGEIWSVQNFAR